MTPTPNEELSSVLDELAAGRHELVIFMTGSAAASLFETAQNQGRRAELLRALHRVTVACRGPKAASVVRGFGLPKAIGSQDSLTMLRLLHALGKLELSGQSVLRLDGVPGDELARRLRARRVQLCDVQLRPRRPVTRSHEGESRYSATPN